jgi:hypothetical protein
VFKAVDLERALDCALDSPATTAAIAMAVLLLVPALPATDGPGPESRDGPRTGAYQSGVDGSYNYQMRCWQHGHLMLEQNLGELPADRTRFPLERSGSDSEGRPVYVAETHSNATCVIRSMAGAEMPPQP